MASTSSSATLFSVGYEGRTLDEFVTELVANGIEVLVDVRLTPISRKAGFSKRALAEALAGAGIAYHHEAALGNPQDNRDDFRRGLQAARQRYERHLDNGARSTFEGVVQLAQGSKVALMCFERDHSTCHRSCITDRAQAANKRLNVYKI
jgi:uncharacterized protein (DUF488 family)